MYYPYNFIHFGQLQVRALLYITNYINLNSLSALTDREMAKTAYTFLSKLFNGGGRMAAGGSQFLREVPNFLISQRSKDQKTILARSIFQIIREN